MDRITIISTFVKIAEAGGSGEARVQCMDGFVRQPNRSYP
jgi:hypothetical protein